MLVSVLAPLAVLDDAAAFDAEAAHQLVTQDDALSVGIDGYIDHLLIVEVLLEVVVEVVEVGVRAVGDADDVGASTFDEAKGVHFALSDDALGRASDGVNVVGE